MALFTCFLVFFMLGIFDIFSLVGLSAFVIENMQEGMRVLQQTNCNVFLAWESAKKQGIFHWPSALLFSSGFRMYRMCVGGYRWA